MSLIEYESEAPEIRLEEIAALLGKDPSDLVGFIVIGVQKKNHPITITDTGDPAQVMQILGYVISAIAGACIAGQEAGS